MSPAAKKKATKSTPAAKAKPKAKATPKAAATATTKKRTPTATKRPVAKRPVLLAGGNPQIAKGEGDGPVAEYIGTLTGWKNGLVTRIDSLIEAAVPGVRRAVKWNSPFYGAPGSEDFFLGLHVMTTYAKLAFFRGQQLEPIPPGESKGQDTRYLDIYESDDMDEALLADWVKQASRLPGWSPRG